MNKRTKMGVICTPVEKVEQRSIVDIPCNTNVLIHVKNHVYLKKIRVEISGAITYDDIKAAVMSHNYIVRRPHLLTISQKRSIEMNAHERRILNREIEGRIQGGNDMLLYDLLTYWYSNGYL